MIRIKKITEDLISFINNAMSTGGHNLNLFPEAAFEGTPIPFMIYRRTNVDDKVSKDGLYERTLTFDVDIVTNKYNDGIDILDDLSDAFYHTILTGTYNYGTEVVNITESVDAENGLFVQTITLTISASQI